MKRLMMFCVLMGAICFSNAFGQNVYLKLKPFTVKKLNTKNFKLDYFQTYLECTWTDSKRYVPPYRNVKSNKVSFNIKALSLNQYEISLPKALVLNTKTLGRLFGLSYRWKTLQNCHLYFDIKGKYLNGHFVKEIKETDFLSMKIPVKFNKDSKGLSKYVQDFFDNALLISESKWSHFYPGPYNATYFKRLKSMNSLTLTQEDIMTIYDEFKVLESGESIELETSQGLAILQADSEYTGKCIFKDHPKFNFIWKHNVEQLYKLITSLKPDMVKPIKLTPITTALCSVEGCTMTDYVLEE